MKDLTDRTASSRHSPQRLTAFRGWIPLIPGLALLNYQAAVQTTNGPRDFRWSHP